MIANCCCFDFIIDEGEQFSFDFNFDKEIDFEFGECFNIIQGDVYDGEYDVIPKAHEKTVLQTLHKVMADNVRVHEIPYDETSNQFGTTVVIAS